LTKLNKQFYCELWFATSKQVCAQANPSPTPRRQPINRWPLH